MERPINPMRDGMIAAFTTKWKEREKDLIKERDEAREAAKEFWLREDFASPAEEKKDIAKWPWLADTTS